MYGCLNVSCFWPLIGLNPSKQTYIYTTMLLAKCYGEGVLIIQSGCKKNKSNLLIDCELG